MRTSRQRRKSKRDSFWSDGLSINETKFSVIVVMALVGFGYALYSHYRTGVIENSLLTLVLTLIYGIIGMNGVKFISDSLQRRRENGDQSNYNEYENSNENGQ